MLLAQDRAAYHRASKALPGSLGPKGTHSEPSGVHSPELSFPKSPQDPPEATSSPSQK